MWKIFKYFPYIFDSYVKPHPTYCPSHCPMIMMLRNISSLPYNVSIQESNSVTKWLLFCAEDLKEVNQHFFSMLPHKLKPSVNFSDYLFADIICLYLSKLSVYIGWLFVYMFVCLLILTWE